MNEGNRIIERTERLYSKEEEEKESRRKRE